MTKTRSQTIISDKDKEIEQLRAQLAAAKQTNNALAGQKRSRATFDSDPATDAINRLDRIPTKKGRKNASNMNLNEVATDSNTNGRIVDVMEDVDGESKADVDEDDDLLMADAESNGKCMKEKEVMNMMSVNPMHLNMVMMNTMNTMERMARRMDLFEKKVDEENDMQHLCKWQRKFGGKSGDMKKVITDGAKKMRGYDQLKMVNWKLNPLKWTEKESLVNGNWDLDIPGLPHFLIQAGMNEIELVIDNVKDKEVFLAARVRFERMIAHDLCDSILCVICSKTCY